MKNLKKDQYLTENFVKWLRSNEMKGDNSHGLISWAIGNKKFVLQEKMDINDIINAIINKQIGVHEAILLKAHEVYNIPTNEVQILINQDLEEKYKYHLTEILKDSFNLYCFEESSKNLKENLKSEILLPLKKLLFNGKENNHGIKIFADAFVTYYSNNRNNGNVEKIFSILSNEESASVAKLIPANEKKILLDVLKYFISNDKEIILEHDIDLKKHIISNVDTYDLISEIINISPKKSTKLRNIVKSVLGDAPFKEYLDNIVEITRGKTEKIEKIELIDHRGSRFIEIKDEFTDKMDFANKMFGLVDEITDLQQQKLYNENLVSKTSGIMHDISRILIKKIQYDKTKTEVDKIVKFNIENNVIYGMIGHKIEENVRTSGSYLRMQNISLLSTALEDFMENPGARMSIIDPLIKSKIKEMNKNNYTNFLAFHGILDYIQKKQAFGGFEESNFDLLCSKIEIENQPLKSFISDYVAKDINELLSHKDFGETDFAVLAKKVKNFKIFLKMKDLDLDLIKDNPYANPISNIFEKSLKDFMEDHKSKVNEISQEFEKQINELLKGDKNEEKKWQNAIRIIALLNEGVVKGMDIETVLEGVDTKHRLSKEFRKIFEKKEKGEEINEEFLVSIFNKKGYAEEILGFFRKVFNGLKKAVLIGSAISCAAAIISGIKSTIVKLVKIIKDKVSAFSKRTDNNMQATDNEEKKNEPKNIFSGIAIESGKFAKNTIVGAVHIFEYMIKGFKNMISSLEISLEIHDNNQKLKIHENTDSQYDKLEDLLSFIDTDNSKKLKKSLTPQDNTKRNRSSINSADAILPVKNKARE